MTKTTAASHFCYNTRNFSSGKLFLNCSCFTCCCGINGLNPRAGSQIPFVRSHSSNISQVFSDPVPDYHLIRHIVTPVPDYKFLSDRFGSIFSHFVNLTTRKEPIVWRVSYTEKFFENQLDLPCLYFKWLN